MAYKGVFWRKTFLRAPFMQRQMLYGGVICYNETGLCQHFSLVLTFTGCELDCCVISRPSLRSSPRPPGQPALLSQKHGPSGKKRGEMSGGKQREAVSNKDTGAQSAVSQIWRGTRDEEEDVSRWTTDIEIKFTNSIFFFQSGGSWEDL